MAMQTGAIFTKLKFDASDLIKGAGKAKKTVSDFGKKGQRSLDGLNDAQQKVQAQINRVSRALEVAKKRQEGFNKSTSELTRLRVGNQIANYEDRLTQLNGKMRQVSTAGGRMRKSLGSSFTAIGNIAQVAIGNIIADAVSQASQAMQQFIIDSSRAAASYKKAMTTLEIIAPRFNVPAEQAKQIANDLGRELRIGPQAAAESLQNLLKSGLGLDQSAELMKRFTNEAITGKSDTIGLAEAVQNLSFAYQTNNSALGNLSGISENFSDVIKAGRESLIKQGVAVEDITDDMAKYEGMINLTNLTLGSAEKFQGGFIDNQARIEQVTRDVQLTIGRLINNALEPLQRAFLIIAEPLAQNETLVESLVVGLGVVAGVIVAAVIPSLIGMAAAVWGVVSPFAPIIAGLAAIGAAAAGLFYLWDTNFLGIKDATMEVWSFLSSIFMPAINELKLAWNKLMIALRPIIDAIWQELQPALMAIWEVIQPFVLPVLGVLAAMLMGPTLVAFGLVIATLRVFASVINWVAENIGSWAKTANSSFQGFKNAVSNTINTAKTILDGFVSFIKNAFNIDLYEVGRNIIQGLLNGLSSMAGQVQAKAQEIANNVKNTITDAMGINSPSTVMMQYGKWVGEGLNIGMEAEVPEVKQASMDLSDAVLSSFDTAANSQTISNNVDNSNINNNININAQNANANDVLKLIDNYLAKKLQNVKLGQNRPVNV